MKFETLDDLLASYEREERILTPTAIAALPWQDVSRTMFDECWLPVMLYMRDVETYTEVYYEELKRSATGKHPAIRRFMDRWVTEEPVHGELLERFLEEAGVAIPQNWKARAFSAIPKTYTDATKRNGWITRGLGFHFAAVHMTWGAINELSTLTGYRRLWELAKHPMLEKLLRAIAREEARHIFFYWNAARILLQQSPFRQRLTRFIIEKFWSPVGEGAKPAADTNRIIQLLFRGEEGLALMEKFVNDKIAALPGMEGFTRVTTRIAESLATPNALFPAISPINLSRF